MSKDNTITFRVDSSVKEKLQILAKSDKRSLSKYVGLLLTNVVDDLCQADPDAAFELRSLEIKKRPNLLMVVFN